MRQGYQVHGENEKALFNLTVHRGEGMVLLAIDWRKGKPPLSFAGFAIEYKEPGGTAFFTVRNRICFAGSEKEPVALRLTTLRSPIQKFRWIHFPRNAQKTGPFTYRIAPVFMNEQDELSYGEPQTADIELRNETFPGQLNVAFTRGFVSSQAFIEKVRPGQDIFDAYSGQSR